MKMTLKNTRQFLFISLWICTTHSSVFGSSSEVSEGSEVSEVSEGSLTCGNKTLNTEKAEVKRVQQESQDGCYADSSEHYPTLQSALDARERAFRRFENRMSSSGEAHHPEADTTPSAPRYRIYFGAAGMLMPPQDLAYINAVINNRDPNEARARAAAETRATCLKITQALKDSEAARDRDTAAALLQLCGNSENNAQDTATKELKEARDRRLMPPPPPRQKRRRMNPRTY